VNNRDGCKRNRRPLFHIGYQKTGSTYLQDHLFKNRESGFAIPFEHARARIIEQFFFANPFTFDPASARRHFMDECESVYHQGLVPVFSDENLIAHPEGVVIFAPIVAERIHASFPDARILICIRDQRSMYYSFYAQMISQSRTYTLDTFIGETKMRPGALPECRREIFAYDQVIEDYQQRFGAPNVLVLPFEMMHREMTKFVMRIIEFADANPKAGFEPVFTVRNPRHRGATLAARRFLNRFTPMPDFTRAEKQPLRFRITGRASAILDRVLPNRLQKLCDDRNRALIEERLATVYTESNRHTSELIGIDLGKYGYDV
jgi:hypothetical protein